MLTKEAKTEGADKLEEEPSLAELVEAYTGQTLGARVEASIGQNLVDSVEQTIVPKRQSGTAAATVTAADLLRYVMIPGTCMGFHQLVTAIELAVEDENRLLNVVDNLYPLVGEAHHSSANSVQKNMRMAIIAGWRNGGGQQMHKLTGLPYDTRPVTKDFIDMMADYLRKRRVS